MSPRFYFGPEGLNGCGYPWASLNAAQVKKANRCPAWCIAPHEEPEEPHYGDVYDFAATIDFYGVRHRKDLLQVGIDQTGQGSELFISITSECGSIWLPLDEANRLAVRMLQLGFDVTDGA